MCLVCIEYSKGKLLPEEGLRNLKEMKLLMEEDHYWEVHAKLSSTDRDWETHFILL